MSSDPRHYRYGDLNPGVTSSPANHRSTVINRTGGTEKLSDIVRQSYEEDNMTSLTRFKGIVLRDETQAQGNTGGVIDSILSMFGGGGERPRQKYKVRIPELHIFPVPNKVSSSTNPEQDPGPHQAIIDMYPTFVAQSTQTESAQPGDIVWVTYENINEQEGPIYLGPIVSRVAGAPPPAGPDPRSSFGSTRGCASIVAGAATSTIDVSSLSTNPGDYGKIVSTGYPYATGGAHPRQSVDERHNFVNPGQGQRWEYQITHEDVLTAAKMCWGESRGNPDDMAAVLWSMTQLFSPWGQAQKFGTRFSSFTQLITAYSQPINPIWRRDGRNCRPGGPSAGTDNCSERRLEKRQRHHEASWEDISETARRVTLQWAHGQLPNRVPRATEFAVSGLVQRKCIERADPAGSVPDNYKIENWFAIINGHNSDTNVRVASTWRPSNWPENHVTIEPGAATPRMVAARPGGSLVSGGTLSVDPGGEIKILPPVKRWVNAIIGGRADTPPNITTLPPHPSAPLATWNRASNFMQRRGRRGEEGSYVRNHGGVDVYAPWGTPVLAVADARVWKSSKTKLGDRFRPQTGARNASWSWYGGGFGSYGNIIVLELLNPAPLVEGAPTEQRRWILYAHLADVTVEEGQTVAAGQQIGLMGNTNGRRDFPNHIFQGPHLHLELSSAPYPLGRRDKVTSASWANTLDPTPLLCPCGSPTVTPHPTGRDGVDPWPPGSQCGNTG